MSESESETIYSEKEVSSDESLHSSKEGFTDDEYVSFEDVSSEDEDCVPEYERLKLKSDKII